MTESFFSQATPITISGEHVTLQHAVISADSQGRLFIPGGAGSIGITAGKNVNTQDSSKISADITFGGGSPGQIAIQAGHKVDIQNSTVSAQSTLHTSSGNGGSINVETGKEVRLTNSQLNTSVSGGSQTVAGDIKIEAHKVNLTNSQILSTAVEGTGGDITITTKHYRSTGSTVDASSQFGTDGTVVIQP